MNIYLDLFLTFFKIGSFTFGGGYAMLPIIQKEIVEKKHWATDEEVLDYYAIGQSTPGIIAVNTATFIGYKNRKTLGAVCATLGIVTPSVIIITFIAAFLNNFLAYEIVQSALKGINIAVAVLLIHAVYKFGKKAIKDFYGILIALLSFSLVIVFHWSVINIILLSVMIGITLTYIFKKTKGGQE